MVLLTGLCGATARSNNLRERENVEDLGFIDGGQG